MMSKEKKKSKTSNQTKHKTKHNEIQKKNETEKMKRFCPARK